MWVLSMESASCRLSGVYNFEVVPEFFEDFCTPVINVHMHLIISIYYIFTNTTPLGCI